MKDLECKYWIVNNDQEKEEVLNIIGNPIYDMHYKYPHIIGQEKDFVFQQEKTEEIEPYINADEQRRNVYVLQSFNPK